MPEVSLEMNSLTNRRPAVRPNDNSSRQISNSEQVRGWTKKAKSIIQLAVLVMVASTFFMNMFRSQMLNETPTGGQEEVTKLLYKMLDMPSIGAISDGNPRIPHSHRVEIQNATRNRTSG